MNWRIGFYETRNGNIPVKEFVDGLPDTARAKFIYLVDLLEQYGLDVREPYVKSMTGHKKVKELRIKTKDNIYRVIFFPFKDKTFVMLHGFVKKTEKTPGREIEMAEKRMQDYIERYG